MREGGVIFIGEKGILMHETYGNNPRIWPDALMEKAKAIPKTLPRITVSHEFNWAAACKGNGKASSPFEYAAGLTETMLLGIVALRAGQGKKILYDGCGIERHECCCGEPVSHARVSDGLGGIAFYRS